MNRANPVDLRKALDVADTLVKAGLLFVCVPVLGEDDRQRLAELTRTRLELIAKAVEDGKPIDQAAPVRCYVHHKSRQFRHLGGFDEAAMRRFAQALAEGFVEVTPEEGQAFYNNTELAKAAGWKPFGRVSFATFMKRLDCKEADQ